MGQFGDYSHLRKYSGVSNRRGAVAIFEFWHRGQLLDTPFTGFDSGTVTRFLENMLGENYSVLQSTLLIDALPKLGQTVGVNEIPYLLKFQNIKTSLSVVYLGTRQIVDGKQHRLF